ncbi:complement regulatory protein [Trypanosoma cruzi]|nr:complement regulatory protein [Trypanosoma cruzi]
MHIAVDFDASFVACAGDCGWLLLHHSVDMKGGEGEGARTASHSSCGCDARGGLRLLWRAASLRCALLRRCAVRLRMSFFVRVCVLGMFFRSVGRPPFFCGLCEWARADEGQGVWNEGMA